MTKRVRLVSVLLLTCLLCLAPACSRKDQTDQGAALYNSPLLKRIPAQSVAFAVWSFERPSAKRMQASQWGSQNAGALDQIKKKLMQGEQSQARLAALLESFQKSGLAGNGDATMGLPFSEAVGFAALNLEKKRPELGIALSASKGNDLAKMLTRMQSELKAQGFSVTSQTFGGTTGFSASLAGAEMTRLPIDTIYVAATEQLLVAVSAPEHLASLLNGTETDGTQRIRSSEQFRKMERALLPSQNEYMLAYADAAFIIQNIEPFLPESMDPESREKIKALHLSSLLLSQSMGETPHQVVLASLTSAAQKEKGWLDALPGANAEALPGLIPSGAVLALSMDSAPLSAFKEAALKDTPTEQQAAFKQELALLDPLKRLSIALLESSESSPLPGAIFQFETSDNAAFLAALKNRLGTLAQGFGLPMSQWQSKKIDNLEISFMQSPMFGVGLFLADTGKGVVAASSEQALLQTLSPSKESARLAKQITSDSPRLAVPLTPLACFFGDFVKLGDLGNSLKGMLGAFTGGQTGVDQSVNDALAKIGTTFVTVSYGDDLLAAQQTFLAPPRK